MWLWRETRSMFVLVWRLQLPPLGRECAIAESLKNQQAEGIKARGLQCLLNVLKMVNNINNDLGNWSHHCVPTFNWLQLCIMCKTTFSKTHRLLVWKLQQCVNKEDFSLFALFQCYPGYIEIYFTFGLDGGVDPTKCCTGKKKKNIVIVSKLCLHVAPFNPVLTVEAAVWCSEYLPMLIYNIVLICQLFKTLTDSYWQACSEMWCKVCVCLCLCDLRAPPLKVCLHKADYRTFNV